MAEYNPSGRNRDIPLIQYLSLFTSGTFLSRVTGFGREVFIAFALGATHLSDIFYVSFRIPNFFRDVVGENAAQTALVPSFLKWEREGKHIRLIPVLFSIFLLTSIGITILGIIFAPFLVKILAYGFIHIPWKYESTVLLTRILFPFLFLISLVAFWSGLLNARKNFFIPAVAPVLFNSGVLITGAIAYFTYGKLSEGMLLFLAFGVLIGGFFQALIHLPYIIKKKLFFYPHLIDRRIKETGFFFRLLTPVVTSASLNRIILFVSTLLASFLGKGAISFLNYAYRIMHLPLAMVGIGISTVSLPDMAKAKNKIEFLKKLYKESFLILLPISLLILADAQELIELFYKRGAFDQIASYNTAVALTGYGFGILPFSLSRIHLNYFYTQGEIITPSLSFLFATSVYLVCALPLAKFFGVFGLALASSISSYVQWLFLTYKTPSVLSFPGIFYLLGLFAVVGIVLYWTSFYNIIIELLIDGTIIMVVYLGMRKKWM